MCCCFRGAGRRVRPALLVSGDRRRGLNCVRVPTGDPWTHRASGGPSQAPHSGAANKHRSRLDKRAARRPTHHHHRVELAGVVEEIDANDGVILRCGSSRHAVDTRRVRRRSWRRGADQTRGTSAWQSSQPVETQRPPSQEHTLLSRGSQVRPLPGALYQSRGFTPRTPLRALSRAASPARSVRVAHSLRSFALEPGA